MQQLGSGSFHPGIDHIAVTKQLIDDNDKSIMKEVIDKGFLTEGEYAKRFSLLLRKQAQKRFCTLTNSGSSANLIAMMALAEMFGSKGKKVITCATGFPTTINPIIQAGFELLIVDANVLTLNANENEVMDLLSRPDVAGVVLAHTLGFPFNENLLAEKCHMLGKFLLADCCDALGSEIKDNFGIMRPVGYFADVHTYSFYPAHMISTAEGGAALTNNPRLETAMRSFRDWGRDCWCDTGKDNTCGRRFNQQFGTLPEGYDHKYTYSRIGYNLKMTDIQAALGFSQMQKLTAFTVARQANYSYMKEMLCNLQQMIFLPQWNDTVSPNPFGFPITVMPHANPSYSKNSLVKFLTDRNIGTRGVFAGNFTRQPAYQSLKMEIPYYLNDSDYIMNNTLWIGCHPSLSKEMLDYMVESLYQFFGIGG
jgi:CDP-6-deoxy-D-xylo-4-hexulose-3-dehydrase